MWTSTRQRLEDPWPAYFIFIFDSFLSTLSHFDRCPFCFVFLPTKGMWPDPFPFLFIFFFFRSSKFFCSFFFSFRILFSSGRKATSARISALRDQRACAALLYFFALGKKKWKRDIDQIQSQKKSEKRQQKEKKKKLKKKIGHIEERRQRRIKPAMYSNSYSSYKGGRIPSSLSGLGSGSSYSSSRYGIRSSSSVPYGVTSPSYSVPLSSSTLSALALSSTTSSRYTPSKSSAYSPASSASSSPRLSSFYNPSGSSSHHPTSSLTYSRSFNRGSDGYGSWSVSFTSTASPIQETAARTKKHLPFLFWFFFPLSLSLSIFYSMIFSFGCFSGWNTHTHTPCLV